MTEEKSLESFLLTKEEIDRRFEERERKSLECEKKGGHETVIVVSYHPSQPNVLEQCTYCETLVPRQPYFHEIADYNQSYHDMLNTVITI